MKKTQQKRPRRNLRTRNPIKFQTIDESTIEYKNIALLQKFITERGKMVPARVSGVSVKGQRKITESIKIARYLGLLSTGGVKK